MLSKGTIVTAISVGSIFFFFKVIFLIAKDQIAAHRTGIITTRIGPYDRSKSRTKYYSIIAVRIFLVVIFGLMSFTVALGLKEFESSENLINRHIFVFLGILAAAVGLWVFRFKESFDSFRKGYTASYKKDLVAFVKRHIVLVVVIILIVDAIVFLAIKKFY
jgi:SNF family Na+-dependent transporter